MDCLSMRASTDRLAGIVLLLSVLVTAAGCRLTIGPSQDGSPATMHAAGSGGSSATADAAQGEAGGSPGQSPDSSGFVDAQSGSGGAQPPPVVDAGPDANEAGVTTDAGPDANEASVATDADDERECTEDVDCPASNPCSNIYCGSSGHCESTVLLDGTSCVSPNGFAWICINGVCQESRCGDGYVDEVEDCDDGNDDNDDDCPACKEARCGDGYVHTGVEQCEPSLDLSCNEDCTLAVCGDGVIDMPVETCEPDTAAGPCNDACRVSDIPEWLVEVLPVDLESRSITDFPVLSLDGAGNPIVVYTETYVVEDSSIPMGKRPGFIAHVQKFNADGQSVWSWSSSESFIAYSVAIDSHDNIIVAGTSMDMQVGYTPWLVKLESNGTLQWSTTVNASSFRFVGVATDDQDDIVALSTSDVTGTISLWFATDPVLEVFDSEGNHLPSEQTTLAGARVDVEALSSELIGGVRRYLIAGTTQSEDESEPYLMLLNADLSQVWEEPVTIDSGESEAGFLRALSTEGGDIIALGANRREDRKLDFWLERFSPEGTRRWTTTKALRDDTVFFNVIPNTFRFSYIFYHFPMAVDGQSNVYVALQDATPFDRLRIAAIDKYTPDGSPAWERPLFFDSGYSVMHPRAGELLEYPLGLAVDGEGTIYVLSTLLTISTIPTPGAGSIAMMNGLWLHKWQQLE